MGMTRSKAWGRDIGLAIRYTDGTLAMYGILWALVKDALVQSMATGDGNAVSGLRHHTK